ncbi:MAG: hypothetical protein BRC31_05000 [Actinobacteria bacterium QS_5_72_10]|nr:MAG: hypothetical protein BRC31_05000 [Actinobacteria bacterium QS_5_72_10]
MSDHPHTPSAPAGEADVPAPGVPRFVWVDATDPALGGQWMVDRSSGRADPVVLADAVAAYKRGELSVDPLDEHVAVTLAAVSAAGAVEDEGLPDPTTRLVRAADEHVAEVDRDSPEGERLRRVAEALHKLASDLSELVEEQLHSGSLANLPPRSTLALCQAIQAAWRLRHHVDPPGPLYL